FGIAKLDEPELQRASEENDALRPSFSVAETASPASEFPTLVGAGTPAETLAAPDQSGAATQASPSLVVGVDFSEAGTQIIVPEAAEVSEAGTQMLPSETIEANTRILEERETNKNFAVQTGTSSSLTRVGAILGTPLYMSPEQCRGETLDARSDIYSLGVIAYRLLSGKTPFSGTQAEVMKLHREELPAPLKVKRVPKKLTALVMAALAKKPDDRPRSAAAFASALRAHSTGVGTLLRHALTLYSEHLPTFLRLAILVYSPVVLMTFSKVILQVMAKRQLIRSPWDKIATGAAELLTVVVTFFSACVVVGVTSWLVTQALAVPLRPLLLRPAFNAMKKRLRPFLLTTLLTNLLCLIGIVMCILPGIYLISNLALVGPLVMMEDLRGRAAMKRSRALYKRSRRTVFAIVFIHIGAPILVASISAVLIVAMVKLFKPAESQAPAIVSMIQPLVSLPITIFFSSLAAVVTALLYWKTRLAGGETMTQALVQFAEEEAATAGRGLKRMRTRFATPMKSNR
ncbi:MAG TPA: protein kinase, partial [Pyrinomonadaceae bacterium]|nr:protein kinase [Pyrinomonadaceae bacterium]